MTHFNHPFTQLVEKRYSCRTFEKKEIEKTKLKTINDFLAESGSGPGHFPRMEIIQKSDLLKENFFTAGTYGMVKGARTFIAGTLIKKGSMAWENFGFAMQQAVMLATDLELNTLWIGGIFDRRAFGKVMRIEKDEIIPAVIALGYAAQKRSARDRIIRWGSGGDRRKSPDRLFFDRFPGNPLIQRLASAYRAALDNVRMAPSASNKQPWRIIYEPLNHENPMENAPVDRGRFHLYLDRDQVYAKIIPQVDLQRIDMGIAMFHLEQSAREYGIRFHQIWGNPLLKNLPGNYEYIISYEMGGKLDR
jgi:hypothetical protein